MAGSLLEVTPFFACLGATFCYRLELIAVNIIVKMTNARFTRLLNTSMTPRIKLIATISIVDNLRSVSYGLGSLCFTLVRRDTPLFFLRRLLFFFVLAVALDAED